MSRDKFRTNKEFSNIIIDRTLVVHSNYIVDPITIDKLRNTVGIYRIF